MSTVKRRRNGGSSREPGSAAMTNIRDLDARRIERALDQRVRYKYVHPRVLREGKGWKVVSPNCSRNIDRQGGEIDIAWLVPEPEAGWLLYSRDHALGCWLMRLQSPSLPALLTHLCEDPNREFWQ